MPVAIGERVNRLELGMRRRSLKQRGKVVSSAELSGVAALHGTVCHQQLVSAQDGVEFDRFGRKSLCE